MRRAGRDDRKTAAYEGGAVSAIARPNVFEVDLDAVARNTRHLRQAVGEDVRIYAAVKGNAYGFGLVRIARTVLRHGADGLALADVNGAVHLRETGVEAPILLYAGALPTPEAVAAIESHRLNPTVLDLDNAKAYARLARKPLSVFVKIAVGLERIGIPALHAAQVIEDVVRLPNLRLGGVYTHLHVVAGPDASRYATWQFDLFSQVLADLRQAGIAPPVTLASSSNVLALTSSMMLNAVDPGRLIYGLPTLHKGHEISVVSPAFASLRTRLIQVKPWRRDAWLELAPFDPTGVDRIGVLPMGRSDGLGELNCGQVLVRGKRVRILGPISLEHARVDLTGMPEATAGDEAVIIGAQGENRITLEEIAEHQQSAVLDLSLAVRESVSRRYLAATGDSTDDSEQR